MKIIAMKSDHGKSRKVRTLDVRPILARGDEPFQEVMATIASLGPSEDFLLISPFMPSPLIEKLQSEGFRATPVRRDDGSWRTEFVRS